MEDIKLVLPTEAYREKALAFKEEFFTHGECIINGSALLDQLDYSDWMAHIIKYQKEETADNDWVPSTTFFAVTEQDNQIIGIIDIRHHIQHPFLTEYGGHIGYSVRPGERRKGYATEMLRLALKYAKEIGLKEVMIGCYTQNTGSVKTIRKHNGKLTQEKLYTDGTPMSVYWIDLTKQE